MLYITFDYIIKNKDTNFFKYILKIFYIIFQSLVLKKEKYLEIILK